MVDDGGRVEQMRQHSWPPGPFRPPPLADQDLVQGDGPQV